MKPINFFAALLAGSAILFAAPAFADQPVNTSPTTTTMNVGVTVVDECTIGVDGPLTFPTWGIFNEDVDGSTTMTIQCTKGSRYEIGLSAGANGADDTHRQMKSGQNLINYELSKSSSFATNWGDTIGDTGNVTSSGAEGTDETIDVYGRITSGQNVPTGVYSDTVTATIWYGGSLH